ncbi:unnamed protein product, partial [Ixodes hexagonus]
RSQELLRPASHRVRSVPAEPPIRVTPDVLLCGTNGRGQRDLSWALGHFCTHIIYTGPVSVLRKSSGTSVIKIKDHLGFRPFRALTDVKKRYLSLPWSLAPWQKKDILAGLVDFIGAHQLTGIELKLTNVKQTTRFIAFCQTFVSKVSGEDSLLIRVDQSVNMTKSLLAKLSRLAAFLILETQAVRMGALHTIRFPNPYQAYNGSHRRDVYL